VDFSVGKFNMTLDCFCGRPIGTLIDSMLWEIPTSSPSKSPLGMGIWTRVNILDDLTIASAAFAGFTVVTDNDR